MTAAELITALQKCPPDAPVYIESGIGYLITDDVNPQWAPELSKIIPTQEGRFESVDEHNKFFLYISSPY